MTEPKRESDRPYAALIVDFGGVLTSSLTTSFAAFCVQAGVDPGALKRLLAAAYAGPGVEPGETAGIVHSLEAGALELEEFERSLASVLSEGRPSPLEPAGLIARLFAASGPDERMIDGVRAARRQGLKTGLISNTWDSTTPGPARSTSSTPACSRARWGCGSPSRRSTAWLPGAWRPNPRHACSSTTCPRTSRGQGPWG